MNGNALARTCPRCLHPVPAQARTCPRDGTQLEEEGDPFAQTAVRKPPPPPREAPALGADPLLGQTLGEYRVEAQIGTGGMGLVYRALQPVIGKQVAIKVLRKEMSRDPEHMERLLAEARAVNAIRHRAIIDIFNFGTLPDGRQYLVMEFLEGEALDEQLAHKGPLPVPQVLAFLRDLASALHAAHQAGVVHRDLKPSNVFVVRQDGVQYVKLLDFGLAEHTEANADRAGRDDGKVMGTPEYMAPEQAHGTAVSPQTDLYALGVMAFEMLTGQLPFQASSPMGYLMAHVQQPPPDVRTLRPEVSPELAALIARMLQKRAEDRPASADEVRNELRHLGGRLWGSPQRTGERPALKEAPRRATPEGPAPRRATPPAASDSGPGPRAPRVRPQQEPRPARAKKQSDHDPAPPAGPLEFSASDPPAAARPPRRLPLGLVLAGVLTLGAGAAWYAASLVDQVLGPVEPPPGAPSAPVALPGGESAPRLDPPPRDARPAPARPRKAPRGSLTLVTLPEAEVRREGRVLGTTPLFNHPLEEGTHALELTGTDGVVRLLHAPIEAGKTTRLKLTLDQLPPR